jgi:hypothetical protein
MTTKCRKVCVSKKNSKEKTSKASKEGKVQYIFLNSIVWLFIICLPSHFYLLQTTPGNDEVVELPILEGTPLASVASETKETSALELFQSSIEEDERIAPMMSSFFFYDDDDDNDDDDEKVKATTTKVV